MTPAAALTSPDVRSITLWLPGMEPKGLASEEFGDGAAIRWFDLVSGGDAVRLFEFLGPLCGGLTLKMLDDLLRPDSRPEEEQWADGQVRLASTFAVYPTKTKNNQPGDWSCPVPSADLLYQPVELLASPDWLLTCWHPTETYSGWDQVGDPGEPRGYEGVKHNVAKRWQKAERHSATAADLGVLVMHELALTYAPASRQLYAALEEWERDLYKDVQDDLTKLQVDPRMLNQLWQARSRLWDWVNPLNVQGLNEDLEKAWLPATDQEEIKGVDKHVDRALADLGKLGETIRSAFRSLQLLKAEAHRDRVEHRFHRVELLAAIFLIPTLIVGFYGANTWVPGQQRQWGFWVMVAAIVVLTVLGTKAVLALQSHDDWSLFRSRRSSDEERPLPVSRSGESGPDHETLG